MNTNSGGPITGHLDQNVHKRYIKCSTDLSYIKTKERDRLTRAPTRQVMR